MVQSENVSAYLYALFGYLGALFGVLFVISLFTAYEFNRRFHIISKITHPTTRKLFNQIRFLFLFIALHFGANLIYASAKAPSDFLCLTLAIMHLMSYIGIGITGMSIAVSRILTLGRTRDNRDD